MITVFIKKRSGSKRQRLFLISIVMILVLSILYGYTSVFTLLYLYGHLFCLDTLHVALISLAQTWTVLIISLLIVFSKKTFFSVAKTLWLLYRVAHKSLYREKN
jgi:hypothetical protein